MAIVTIEKPVSMPVGLADARIQCMLDADLTDEDVFIESLIASAVDFCERYTNRPLIPQKKRFIGRFSSCVQLMPNLISVEEVKYFDKSLVEHVLSADNYYVDTTSIVGNVSPLKSWPTVANNHPQPVSINFTCGYGGADKVPESIKQCILLLVGHWFRNREAVTVGVTSSQLGFSVDSLLEHHIVSEV